MGVQVMLAEADCRRLIHAYGRAVDWRDHAGLALLFWPDAHVDLGFFAGDAPAAIAFLLANAEKSERRLHATMNTVLSIDGDVAEADSGCITHAIAPDETGRASWHLFFGRYLDRFTRRAGEWRFSERRFLLDGFHTGAYEEPDALGALTHAVGLTPDHPLFRFR